jgi:hypothetical protein
LTSQDAVQNGAFVSKPGGVQGRVWLDVNANYFQDLNEPPLPNVTVILHQSDSSFVLARTTDQNGRYQFDHQPPGAYFCLFLTNAIPIPLKPTFGLDAFGQTPVFAIETSNYRVVDVGFVRKTSSLQEAENQAFAAAVHPNPASDMVWIDVSEELPETRVRIVDIAGRTIENRLLPTDQRLYIQYLSPGLYFIVLENELGKVIMRLVKT